LIKEIQNDRNLKTIDASLEKLRSLLSDEEPGIYHLFRRYFRKIWDENAVYREEVPEVVNENTNVVNSKIEIEEKEDLKLKPVPPRGYEPKKWRGGKRGPGRVADMRNILQPVPHPEKIDVTTLPPTIRNELYLFEYLRSNLDAKSYDELLKILYLYTECVIGAPEVFQMTRHLFEENENYFSFFCDIITTREITRRRNTTILKPLGEVDFNKLECERSGSYTKVPDFFPHMKSPLSAINPLAIKILNKTWISVPQGSETNFKIKAKNAYEENLFRSEDERYEFDTVIYNCTTAVKWLNSLESLESEEKLANMVERILRLKVIQKVYGNNAEVIEIFKKTPVNVAKILADRVSTKLREIKETKFSQARKKWQENAQENFHRSLDHRSFYFKQYEKKLTNYKSFNTEANDRYKDLNILGNIEDLKKHWSILNTFEGISTGVSCQYEEKDQTDFFNSVKQSSFPTKNLPIYRMVFANKKISQDIFDILCLRIQNFHTNSTEKDKINRFLRTFMLELLRLPYETGRNYDVTLDLNTFSDMASRIETKIYDKSFSSYSAKRDSKNANGYEETIFSAVEKQRQPNKEIDKKRDYDADGREAANSFPQSRKINEELAPKKNPTESLEDELRLDSGSEDQTNIKEMEYATENNNKYISDFIPQTGNKDTMFYGTQHIFYLVRFYFTLYERFLKAYEISYEFEPNVKTANLSKEERKRISEERYETFKWVLIHLLRSNIESEKYEDLLRSLFGNKAYLMFYIEKIIHLIIITIQKLVNDEITMKTLSLYPENDCFGKSFDPTLKGSGNSKSKNWVENIYLGQLNHLTLKNLACLQTTTFFRFLYTPESSTVVINLYNSPYKDWNDKILDSTFLYTKDYESSLSQGSCLNNSLNTIYLLRAREKNRKKTVRTLIKVVQNNKIDYKYVPNTIKIVTDSFHQEDFLHIVKRRKTPEEELIKKISTQSRKINRFRAWHKNVLQNLNK